MIRTKQEQLEDENIQKDLRDELNPGWRGQIQEHYRALHVERPQKKAAKEIINRAMVLEGFSPKRKRKRGSVFT